MFVVTTPTGHIGSKLVPLLLAAGERVRVIVRDPDKLAPGVREKVEVVRGSSDDEAVLSRALEGAESLFHCVPPSFATGDTTSYYLQFTRPACRAALSRRVKRIVTVSGIGRRVAVKAGVVSSAFAKDDEIERSGIDCRALWCPGFMENMLRNVATLKAQGAFYGCGRPDFKAPFVATRDIAASAAKLLLDRSWSGPGGLAVLGPEDLSQNDMAGIMTEVLGTPIRYQPIPVEAYRAQLVKRGANEAFVRSLIEMHLAKEEGLDLSEPRSAENTTPTTFRRWCEEVLRPVFAAS